MTNVSTPHPCFCFLKMVWLRAKGHIRSFEVSSPVGPSALITFHISVQVLPEIDHLLAISAYSGFCYIAHL